MARYSSRISNKHMVAVRFSSLGDVVLTTGVLLDWHEKHGTMFTVITKEAFEPIFDHNPAVLNVIGFDENDLRGQAQSMNFRGLMEKYRDSPLLDLHRNIRSAMLARIWRDAIICYNKMSLARRIFLWSKGRFFGEELRRYNVPQRYAIGLYDKTDVPSASQLRPRIFLAQDEKVRAEELLAPLHTEGEPIVALHPFATHEAKSWPLDVWLRFAAMLNEAGISYFWVGQGEGLPEEEESRSFVNKTALRELFALIASADVLVTGDSGPMHIATAVDTPALAMFGPTCREWGFFPSGEKDRVVQLSMPCRPCSLHGSGACPKGNACIMGISPERMLEELKDMLA
ncbi:glycosyltransferase family 9 protein [uncultured Mailhella sp.]|uniref:glycosyltransferase family 9 protein n=1 Tax=uncultured Mailhella sp. TaxID=1981031 RepID=UPI0025D70CBE|nr:glycosyltransferase family 9 protein [uncultured Mailhella sp.]